MPKIEVKPRRFIIDIDEHETASLVLALKKFNQITSPAYKLKEDLLKKLGYEPQELDY